MEITDSFKVPDYAGCGIYAIINMKDRRAYVGMTRNIKRRASSHLSQLKNNNHPNIKLQNDSQKELKFLILQKLDKETDKRTLEILEISYMIEMDRERFELYNINLMQFNDLRVRIFELYIHPACFENAIEAIRNEYGQSGLWDRKQAIEEKISHDKGRQ